MKKWEEGYLEGGSEGGGADGLNDVADVVEVARRLRLHHHRANTKTRREIRGRVGANTKREQK